jgi:hypothetical protein
MSLIRMRDCGAARLSLDKVVDIARHVRSLKSPLSVVKPHTMLAYVRLSHEIHVDESC